MDTCAALAVLFVLALGYRRKQVLAFQEGMLARGIRVTVDAFNEVPTAYFNDGGVPAVEARGFRCGPRW